MSYDRIRPDIRASLDRYVSDGVPLGDFLQAVLANDLFDALGRADEYNRETIWDICFYVYNEMPSACWKTREHYKQWLGMHRNRRMAGASQLNESHTRTIEGGA